jgi:hypothetical protein
MTPRLPPAESLTVEFKSDRQRLSDHDLVEAIVCLANAEGGELWLGVEDDGTPTGLHAEHRMLDGLPGLVAARTSPAVSASRSRLWAVMDQLDRLGRHGTRQAGVGEWGAIGSMRMELDGTGKGRVRLS